MSDMGDFWRDIKPIMKERSSRKKERNATNAYALLDKNNIPYEVKNGGIYLVIDGHIDYWPTTGKFINRENKRKGRGIFKLLEIVRSKG